MYYSIPIVLPVEHTSILNPKIKFCIATSHHSPFGWGVGEENKHFHRGGRMKFEKI